MSNLLIVVLSMFSLAAFAGTSMDLQPEQPAGGAPKASEAASRAHA